LLIDSVTFSGKKDHTTIQGHGLFFASAMQCPALFNFTNSGWLIPTDKVSDSCFHSPGLSWLVELDRCFFIPLIVTADSDVVQSCLIAFACFVLIVAQPLRGANRESCRCHHHRLGFFPHAAIPQHRPAPDQYLSGQCYDCLLTPRFDTVT
jgi:hypothetical protein